jgi:hypothetical protein
MWSFGVKVSGFVLHAAQGRLPLQASCAYSNIHRTATAASVTPAEECLENGTYMYSELASLGMFMGHRNTTGR